MPAVNVARTDTFEQQRVKINEISDALFAVTSGGSDLSTGNLKLGDGTVSTPSLAFVNDETLGIYRNGAGTIGFASSSKKIADLSADYTKYYRDFVIEKNSLDTLFLSITDPGQNYDGGSYTEISVVGGTGDSATVGVEVDGFVGSITNTGTGYDPGTYLNIPVIGGNGSGALIDFTVEQISGSVTNGGINYYGGTYSNVSLTGGTGSGMEAEIIVSSFGATVTSGSNYPNGLFKSVELTGGNGAGIKVNLRVQNGGVQPFGGVDSSEFVSVTSQYTVGDVLTGTISTTGTQTFEVKSSLGNKYFIDGFEGGDFSLLKGKTYVFDASHSSSNQHPFFISTTQDDTGTIIGSADGVTYELDGVTVTPTDFLANYLSATSKIVTYAVPANPANSPVYYGCSVHPLMGGALTLADPNAQQAGFQLVVDEVGGSISGVTITNSGDGQYTLGDVLSVDPLDLYDQNNLQAAVEGSGFQFTLGGNFGAIETIDQIANFGSGYQVGDVLTLAQAVNNVTTYARGELDFLGLTFTSNAGATALSYSGSATGATRTITNIVPTNSGNTTGNGLTITVDVLFAGGNSSYDNVTITAAGSGYLPGDTLYVPGSQLGGADGAPGGGGGGNDLLISINSIEPGNPQINIGDTTGVSVGDSVDVIQNINNAGQIPGGTLVQSVDSATTITLSEAPTSPGSVDLRITNQNLTYLTVPDTSNIVSGMQINVVSGTGSLIQGTTVANIIDATTLEASIAPIVAGAMVVNFEPEYGAGSNFAYTISELGVVSDISVIDGGNGYSVGDVLTINSFDLVQPEVYAVTNLQIEVIEFVSTVLPDTTFAVGDLVRDPGGAIVAVNPGAGTTIAGAADQVYNGVAQLSTTGSGVGAEFDIQRDNTGAILSVTITTGSEGAFHAQNDVITIAGATIGGSTPADNLTVTVSAVTDPQTAVEVVDVKTGGGVIQSIIINRLGFSDGDILVKESAPTVGYDIDTATTEYRYFMDLNDGNGSVLTPSWTMYAGNSYQFDLSDASNGSHVFALSKFPDGMWGPSRVENVNTTLSTVGRQITVNSTTNILVDMDVVKVSGDGILGDGTKVESIDGPTTLTLSTLPTTAGDVVLNFMGSEYTDGVTRDGDTLTIKVTDSTPNLYYYCATDNADHVNEGGGDGNEALITIDPVNNKVFGSGLQILVTGVTTEEIVKGDVITGEFTCTKLTTQNVVSPEGTISALSSATGAFTTSVTTPLVVPATGNLEISAANPLVDSINFNALTLNLGSVLDVDGTTGDLITTGYIQSPEFRVGSNLKLEDATTSITSFNTQDIKVVPDLGRIVNIDTVTALAVPVGNTSERPPAGIVLDGCIRFNTETNQYEGYSATTQAWSSLGGVRDLDGNTYILAEETIGANDNTLWFINDNVNTIKVSPSYLEFINMKKIRSLNVNAPAYINWAANSPVTVGQYLKYKNNLYEVVTAGITATSGNEPTHTVTGSGLPNGTAELAFWGLAVAPITFEDVEELRIGPTSPLPLVINGDLRLADNVISTDVNDILIRPNSGKKVTVDASTTLTIPVGSDAERGTPNQGGIRFNTTSTQFEGYDGANWGSLGGVKDVDQNTYIIPELTPGGNQNILYFYNDGNNTLQVTTAGLDFFSIDTIRSQTSDEFEITASLLTIDNAATTLDNTTADRSFLHTSKQYFDLGLSAGLSVDPVLRLDNQGDVYLNIGFGTGTFNGVKVFDGDLKEFELADVRILTEKLTLVKGTSNNGSSELYTLASNVGCRTTIFAENTTTGEKEFIEFGVLDDGTDIFHTEYGNVRTGQNLIIPTFEVTGANIARINIELGATIAPTESINITVVSNITKK